MSTSDKQPSSNEEEEEEETGSKGKMAEEKERAVKVALKSVILGLLLGFLLRSIASTVMFTRNGWWIIEALSEWWKAVKSRFSRHTLFFVVNAVVLLVLFVSGCLSQSPRGRRIYLKAPSGSQPSTSKSRLGKELKLAVVERKGDGKKQSMLGRHNIIDLSASTSRALGSPVEAQHNHVSIDDELDDLNERIEAFIAKVRRNMKMQEEEDHGSK